MGINTGKSQNIPVRHKKRTARGRNPSHRLEKNKDGVPSATPAFPVPVMDGGQRVHSPINPKDIQAIVKAIVDKGLNSALVSTLMDGVFGGGGMRCSHSI